MSQAANSSPPPTAKFANRPPRINITHSHSNNGLGLASVPLSAQPPFTAQTTHTLGPGAVAGQPYWPQYSNPFAAGNFMARGFDGIVDFTKSGMSFGEKFTYGLYNKISKWSRRWFTHFFLLTVVTLYSVGGALLFQAIEGGKVEQERIETHAVQKEFFKAMKALAHNYELRKYNSAQFDGQIIRTLRDYQTAVETLLNSNKTLEEIENEKNPWSFWNAMFYCGTIYTTIVRTNMSACQITSHIINAINKISQEILIL